MKLVTWNVNSIKARLPRLLAFLERESPDVVCLQETKTVDEEFPATELVAAGYEAVFSGQRTYNGVAILSRVGLEDPQPGFDGDPTPAEPRLLRARAAGITVVCAYVINGKEIGDPAYDRKLEWLDALGSWLRSSFDPAEPLVVAGDFNICPDDRDVYDPEAWRGRNLCSDAERTRLGSMFEWGLTDLGRAAAGDTQGPWSFWDYRSGAFHRGWGLRIDLALGTAPVAERLAGVRIDRDERKPTSGEGKPSDHAPVIVELRD